MQKLASRLYIKEAETAELVRTLWRSHYKLLLWGGLCFLGLTVSNALLVIDKLALPLIDLSAWRLVASLLALLIMLYGMIWDTE
ncbi:MAG: hypothetical protein HY231_08155 [Acidobacteria bacterium]|nr:hypothetical protein [Acidobacteriota bacterium]